MIEIISKLNSLNGTDDDIKSISYQTKCDILRKNPVLGARHFQYKVETFFKVFVLNGPLGKIRYCAF